MSMRGGERSGFRGGGRRRGLRGPRSGSGMDAERRVEIPTSSSRQSDHPSGMLSESFAPIVGTCYDMCPGNERIQRERLRDLSIFERLDGNPRKTSSTLAVKKFCRTLSSMHAQMSEVRLFPVLQKTFNYLFNLLQSSDHPFEAVHAFVSDRLRSIRQDLSMQRIHNDQVIIMYEEMVKFHIISHQKLLRCREESTSLVFLNMEQLVKILTSLYDMYSVERQSNETCLNQGEFYSFYVLLHLGCNNQTAVGDSLSLWFRNLPFHLLQTREMCFARGVLRCFQMGNYVQFFRMIAISASYLQLCLIESVVNEVRTNALCCVNSSGHKLQPYPLIDLSKLLMVDVGDLESICNLCNLKTTPDEVCGKILPTKQINFCRPKEGFPQYDFVGSERLRRWQDLMSASGNLFHDFRE